MIGYKLRAVCFFTVIVLLTGMMPIMAADDNTDAGVYGDNANDGTTQEESVPAAKTYFNYYYENKEKPQPSGVITADPESEAVSIEGREAILLKDNDTWRLNVPESGVYSLYITYFPLEGTGKDIEISVKFDGNAPFEDIKAITLPRIWADQAGKNGSVIRRDNNGNDLRPIQEERPLWIQKAVGDVLGMYKEPYLFYLEEGNHTLRIDLLREAMAIAKIEMYNAPAPPAYKEYIKQYEDKQNAEGAISRQEAELPYIKTSPMLYAVYDRTSFATKPNSPQNIRLNTIGQTNWGDVGQAITWKVEVPEEGFYELAFRARQNYNPGMVSYRTLYINGEIPFEEAKNISFSYHFGWVVKRLGDEKPLQVYLKPGDELTLECPPGEMSEVLREINQAVLNLNNLYRDIIMITGASPDIYRDYSLERDVPGLIETMTEERDRLNKIASNILDITGKTSSQTSTLYQAALILEDFIKNPFSITERLSSFKSNIEGVSSLLLSFGQQPLELDCIYYIPPGRSLPRANESFFEGMIFSLKKFIASFTQDYNTMNLDRNSSGVINVWVTTGRDQAQILNDMIADDFTDKTGITVNLSIVNMGTGLQGAASLSSASMQSSTLIQATLAGKGPDIALMVGSTDVVNFAMRDALVDLSDPAFDLEDALWDQFYPTVWTPFYYNGGIYAVPETLLFNMVFYRTDIFNEFGLKPPSTWDEFYSVLQVLQSNNLMVGINEIDGSNQGVSASISIFDSLLFQRGGTYYNDGLTATLFDTTAALEAFDEWAELYSKYKIPRELSIFNRFRTGEMPMCIAPYTTYNQLIASAPELRGLWKMAELPGRLLDGAISRAAPSVGSGAMMLKSAGGRDVRAAAFEFLKWWADGKTQARYGRDMEAILGVAARYNPAGIEAFESIGWTAEEFTVLKNQMESVVNVKQIPGNYMLYRELTNALRSSLDYGRVPRRELSIYNRSINAEITRKRTEFHLN